MGVIADCSRDLKCWRSCAGDFAWFGETGWQDIRAMYDLEASGEKGALPGKIFTMCIPKQRFAGLFEYAARKSCQEQLILDT